uniref:Signal transducer and activator of transcription 1b n=1 Tax=Gasterosteus aculeatus TaxID=69293 RepID=G3NDV7_GASAC
MSQWQDVLRMDSVLQARVSQLYEGKFPREIRHSLCVPIESHDWDLAAMDENAASACFHALLVYLEELRNRSVQENNILQGPDYPGMRQYLLRFEDKPLNLAIILSEILTEEKKILDSASEAPGCSSPATNDKCEDLDNNVNELKRQTLEVKTKMKSLEFLNENIDFIQKTWQSQVEQHVGLAKSQGFVEEQCHKRTNFITQTKKVVLQQIENILNLAQKMVASLTDVELPQWKRRQQMACIGAPADTSLDHLQKWRVLISTNLARRGPRG